MTQLVRWILGISGRRRFLLAVLVVVGVAGAVTIAALPRCPSCNFLGFPSKTLGAEQVTITPDPNAHDVDPVAHVVVKANAGMLTDVRMVNDGGKRVEGVMTPDYTVWKPTVPLGYGRTYTLKVSSRGPNGVDSTQVSSFSTLRPSNQTKVSFTATSEAALKDGGTYGIGVVLSRTSTNPSTTGRRRATAGGHHQPARERLVVLGGRPERPLAARKVLHARHFREREGRHLRSAARRRAVRARGRTATFTIGDAHVSVADDKTKQVSVYDNGALVRTMPTSMGTGGTQTIGGHTLSFWTPPGVYTVLDKANPVIMDSSTYGLPINRGSAIARPSRMPPESAPTASIFISSMPRCGRKATPTPRTAA